MIDTRNKKAIVWEEHLGGPVSADKALRFDQGKLDWTLLDFPSLEPAVRVMAYGAKKYTITKEDGTVVDGRENWKKPNDDPMQHIRCALRHLIAIANGELIDPESHQPHSGHLICNAMMFNFHMKDKLAAAKAFYDAITTPDTIGTELEKEFLKP